MAKNLENAKRNKEDEFYTKLEDVKKELDKYIEHFKDKVIYCNCDNPKNSSFYRYFYENFENFGLKKLIASFYDEEHSYMTESFYDKYNNFWSRDFRLDGNGDFRSEECISILKSCDIVVTNPPFSLFREYITQLMEYNKQFIVLGNQTMLTYKEIFPLIQENKLWTGYYTGDMEFVVPDYYEPRKTRYREENGIKYRSMGNICWFTNIDIEKRHQDIPLLKDYDITTYSKYDNYDAINVNKISEIPENYNGVIGVPITFINKYNPTQFKIIKFRKGNDGKDLCIQGKCPYFRVLIQRK